MSDTLIEAIDRIMGSDKPNLSSLRRMLLNADGFPIADPHVLHKIAGVLLSYCEILERSNKDYELKLREIIKGIEHDINPK